MTKHTSRWIAEKSLVWCSFGSAVPYKPHLQVTQRSRQMQSSFASYCHHLQHFCTPELIISYWRKPAAQCRPAMSLSLSTQSVAWCDIDLIEMIEPQKITNK